MANSQKIDSLQDRLPFLLLYALAQSGDKLKELAFELEKNPGTMGVIQESSLTTKLLRWSSLKPSGDKLLYQHYIDVELVNGRNVTWSLWVAGDGVSWLVEADIRTMQKTAEVTEVIDESGELEAADCLSLIAAIEAATQFLIQRKTALDNQLAFPP